MTHTATIDITLLPGQQLFDFTYAQAHKTTTVGAHFSSLVTRPDWRYVQFNDQSWQGGVINDLLMLILFRVTQISTVTTIFTTRSHIQTHTGIIFICSETKDNQVTTVNRCIWRRRVQEIKRTLTQPERSAIWEKGMRCQMMQRSRGILKCVQPEVTSCS